MWFKESLQLGLHQQRSRLLLTNLTLLKSIHNELDPGYSVIIRPNHLNLIIINTGLHPHLLLSELLLAQFLQIVKYVIGAAGLFTFVGLGCFLVDECRLFKFINF